jgi:TP901 family phage tail tape measure protein
MRGRMVEAAAVGYTLARGLTAPVKAAMEFESAMADVRKVVDFEDGDEFKRFSNSILEMSTRIPMAAKGFATLVANAGQAGIAKNEIAEFAEMASKVGVAFDITAERAGEDLAKLKTGLNLSVGQTGRLADAMNHLSNSMASSAPDILDVVRRVGAQGKQFGFNAIQVSAFGSAMLSAGAESDVAATSFRNMGNALTRGASATKAQRKAYAQLGLDATSVAKRMQKDAVGTTLDVMERLSKLPAHMRASVSSDLFGNEARALDPLLTNLPLLREALGLVAKETQYAGSANREYEVRAQTFANSLQLFQNRLTRMGIRIGSALMPALNNLMEAVSPLIDGIASLAEKFPGLTRAVLGAAAGLIAYRAAAIAASWASLSLKGGFLGLGKSSLSFGRGLRAIGGAALTPFIKAGTKVLGILQIMRLRFRLGGKDGLTFGRLLSGAAATGARALASLLNPIKLVRGALGLLKLALIGTGIGAILVAIGAAGAWIYRNWKGIGVAFEAFKGAYMREIQPVLSDPHLQSFLGWLKDLAGAFESITGEVEHGKMASFGLGLGKRLGEMTRDIIALKNGFVDWVQWVSGLPDRISMALAGWSAQMQQLGSDAINGMWQGMQAMAAQMLAWVKSLPGIVMDGIASLPGMVANAFSFGGSAPPIAGARAGGGGVDRGRTYLVGEKGPELFTANASGRIAPNSQLGGSGATINQTINFSISGAQDTRAIVDEVKRAFATESRKAMRGAFADFGVRNA